MKEKLEEKSLVPKIGYELINILYNDFLDVPHLDININFLRIRPKKSEIFLNTAK